jgi:hypothetical protein
MTRRVTLVALAVVLAVIALRVAWPHLEHWMLTGRLFPIDRIEALRSPVSVRGWDETGLFFADGRHVKLPEFSRLPAQSVALSEATKRGVELGADGRIYGLVRVHHWCGNDPVREHVARVDLSHMLTFIQEGERTRPPSDPDVLAREPGGQFSEWGWRVGEFGRYEIYRKYFVGEQDGAANGSRPFYPFR